MQTISGRSPVRRVTVVSASEGAVYVSQEFDLGEVEIDFILFVPRGANRKKYFLVKEDRSLKQDILKSIAGGEHCHQGRGESSQADCQELKDQQVPKGSSWPRPKSCTTSRFILPDYSRRQVLLSGSLIRSTTAKKDPRTSNCLMHHQEKRFVGRPEIVIIFGI